MVNKSLSTKQSSIKAVKRKFGDQSTIHESKLKGFIAEKAKKVPLKAELILKLKELEKEHEALKSEIKKYIEINQELKRKVLDLEKKSEETEQRKMEAGDDIDTEDLDLSFGPRYCNKCGYETEDGYQLDGHLWSEHEDEDDVKSLLCPHCDQTFPILKELMTHKKTRSPCMFNM